MKTQKNKLNKKKQTALILTANFIMFAIMFAVMLLFLNTVEWYVKTIAYVCISGFTASSTVFACLKKEALFKSFFVFNLLTFIIISIFFVLNVTGLFDSFSDMSKIKQLIIDWGPYGYILYVVLQLFQVIILPAPGFIFYLAGTALYGPTVAFIISYISVVIGSFIAFYIGRLFGKPVVYWCVGRDNTEKYLDLIGDKGNVLFVLMQLLPFFPDDILCMIAGLTKMRFRFFAAVMVLVRPIYIAAVCFLGTGDIIPFSGWGLFVWIAIFAVIIAGLIFYYKYKKFIEEKLKTAAKRKTVRKKS